MTRALTHFFGSTDGYRTLARAPGVTDAEDAALASLGFGSPRTQADFDALDSQPCMAGRVLPSGRFAITRVFPGEPDVAGRQTVERRTLIVDAKGWADLLACDLAATLAQAGTWRRERFAAGEAIEVEPLPGEDLLPEPGDDERRVFDALLEAHGTGRCATLPNDARWCRALLRLGGFLPAERTIGFGWGVGLWAVPQGVWLATLRPDAQPRNNFPARLGGAFMHLEEVTQLGRGEAAKQIRTSRKRKGERTRRMPPPWVIGAALALVLIVLTAWLVFAVRKKPEQAQVLKTLEPASESMVAEANPPVSMPVATSAGPPESGSTATAAALPALPAGSAATNSTGSTSSLERGTASEETNTPGTFRSSAISTTHEAFGSGNPSESNPGATKSDPLPSNDQSATESTSVRPTKAEPEKARPSSNAPSSALWTDELDLLVKAIELRKVCETPDRNLDEMKRRLDEIAGDVQQKALEWNLNSKNSGNANNNLYFVNDSGAHKKGPSQRLKKSADPKTHSEFPPEVAKQVALLLATFEVGQMTLQINPKTNEGPCEKGWPKLSVFGTWYAKPDKDDTAQGVERILCEGFLEVLRSRDDVKDLQKALESLRDACIKRDSRP